MSGDSKSTITTAGILYQHAAPCQFCLLRLIKEKTLDSEQLGSLGSRSIEAMSPPKLTKKEGLVYRHKNAKGKKFGKREYIFKRLKQEDDKKQEIRANQSTRNPTVHESEMAITDARLSGPTVL